MMLPSANYGKNGKMIIPITSNEIIFNRNIQDFCRLPYPQHSNGCPNYNKKNEYPPNQKLINEILDFNKNVYLIYTEFNLRNFAGKMGKKHPEWTCRQRNCCLYWQGKARKEHRKELEVMKKNYEIEVITYPERYGCNINAMLIKKGIKLEWPARKMVRIVSLGGYKNES